MAKFWFLDFNDLQGPVEKSNSFSKAPGYYHRVLVVTFFNLFVYLFIFSVNKFLLTTANKNPLQIKSLKRQSHRGVLLEEGVLRMCCRFSGVCMCASVILIKLQSGFVGIALLHCCSPVRLLHVCGASFWESTSRGLLLNGGNFTCNF